MNHNYKNPLRRQCLSLQQLAPIQLDSLTHAFTGLFPEALIRRIDRLVVTGCADSYFAAMECKGAFSKYMPDCRFEAVKAIDAARYLSFANLEPNTMLVTVSTSGAAARITEILERGKKHNCITVAITNSTKSPAAMAADFTYLTKTSFFPTDPPGIPSYFASLLSLIVMAAAMGEIRTKKIFLPKLKEELLAYNKLFFADMEQIDNSCMEVSNTWKRKKGFEVVADGPLFYCGEFIAAKYAEISGDKCTVIDSENYCHVNGLIRPGEDVGTIVLAASDEANMAHVAGTIARQVLEDGRSVLLICDKAPENVEVMVDVDYCKISVPPSDFRFLLLLYAYIPGVLMAGYHSQLLDEPCFRVI